MVKTQDPKSRVKLKDFMPGQPEEEQQEPSPEQLLAKLRSINKACGGEVL